MACLLAVTACGPTVVEPQAGDDGTAGSGAGTVDDSATDGSEAGDGPTSGGTVVDEGSGGPGVCGDGALDPGEACDDGNDVDADGCSHLCEPSGTVSWSIDLSPSRGVGVGLDTRDGEAFVLVEDYHDGLDTNVEAISSRVSPLGELLGQFVHAEGLADLDVAREAIAGLPGGEVVVGYHAPDFNLARLDLATGPLWSEVLEDWRYSFATRWLDGEIYTLRGSSAEDSGPFAVLRFADTGQFVETIGLDDVAPGAMPLAAGPLFVRGQHRLVVLTWASDRLQVHALAGGWSVVELELPMSEPPRAFLHGFEIAVWTDTERFMIDVIDHVQPREPRVVLGSVLTSFVGGVVIQDEQRIDVYDDTGALRWSHVAAAIPRLAAVDGNGGLLVLSDLGVQQDVVVLERLVL